MIPERGTTTIELLVAMTTGLMITASAFALVVVGNRAATAVLDRQARWSHIRSAAALWASEWRGAGYDPTGTAGAEVTRIAAGTLEFAADWNADGALVPTGSNPNERLAYALRPGVWRRGVNGGPRLPLAWPDSATFVLRDSAGRALVEPFDPATAILVDLRVRSGVLGSGAGGIEVVWTAERRVTAR